ncbi:hypothetical protein R0J90_20110, partial [Micrococcus sp. SIMBA_144]
SAELIKNAVTSMATPGFGSSLLMMVLEPIILISTHAYAFKQLIKRKPSAHARRCLLLLKAS